MPGLWYFTLRWKVCKSFLFLILVLLLFPIHISAAEVQQVRSSSLLQIGDRNRSYTVRLACVDVAASDEVAASNFLKKKFRQNKRVNLKPEASIDGILLARVIPIQDEIDLGQLLSDAGLSTLKC